MNMIEEAESYRVTSHDSESESDLQLELELEDSGAQPALNNPKLEVNDNKARIIHG